MKLPKWSYIAFAIPLIVAIGFAGVRLAAKPKTMTVRAKQRYCAYPARGFGCLS